MTEMELNVELHATGAKGPARSQADADADQAAGLAMIDQKRARLAELRSQFESKGNSPERARALAAQAYAMEG